jgi:chromosome segregation ATPase
MRDTEFECMVHGWRSDKQVCPFCMIMVLEEDIKKYKDERDTALARLAGFINFPNIDSLRQCMIDAADENKKLKTELADAKMEIDCEERRFNDLTDLVYEVSNRANTLENELTEAQAKVSELLEILGDYY